MIREGTALDPGASPSLAAASVVPLIVGSLPDRMIPDPAGYVAICVDRTRLSLEHSYGFRPGRSAHQAVAQDQLYIAASCHWVVDLDLEWSSDRVNKLMGQVAKRIADPRLRKLLLAFLKVGVMENGLVSPSVEWIPQGRPLSSLLSNLVLDDLDRELERRGHRFVCYADDSNMAELAHGLRDHSAAPADKPR